MHEKSGNASYLSFYGQAGAKCHLLRMLWAKRASSGQSSSQNGNTIIDIIETEHGTSSSIVFLKVPVQNQTGFSKLLDLARVFTSRHQLQSFIAWGLLKSFFLKCYKHIDKKQNHFDNMCSTFLPLFTCSGYTQHKTHWIIATKISSSPLQKRNILKNTGL